MIYQTDPEFPSDVKMFGCYFLSLLWHLDTIFSLGIMDHKTIGAIYANEIADDDIGPECYLQNPQGICEYLAPKHVRFMGKYPASYTPKSGEFEIQRWYNSNTEMFHFVAGGSGKVLYDPWSAEGSRTVREGMLDSRRVFATL
jgi:hypothetical protein